MNERVSKQYPLDESESESNNEKAILRQILKLAPRVSTAEMEEECIQEDLLQFLKIVSYEFTNQILSKEEQTRIHFQEPHLILTSTNSFPNSTAFTVLLHADLPKLIFLFIYFFSFDSNQ
ncbi:hypothetical protein RFI_12461 [Reticulomyxa filosa]|uniref:Uncharacterized protein n=1 Tax=Reticulomyxa filosa TaxID=46433 RepID=X6NH66_RETFI|nr:hypothetical protein RFI_12461 [Reticulomyxa filosa]|eukprot:ETO24697.1 hypothetical protein RFI_12461 [Reticulomyxa filosa]